MTTIDGPAEFAGQRTRWGTRGAYVWFCLSALAIAVFAPLPYLASGLRLLADGDSPLAANYVDRAAGIRLAFYLHIVFAGLALLLSPLQFAGRLRARAPRVHRVIGRVVLTSIAVGGTAGLVIAPLNVAGPVGTAGFGMLALLWLGCGWTAFRAIRRGDVLNHRRWMVRTFALTYAAVTLRLWLGILIGLQIGFGGVDEDLAFDRAYLIVPFLAWIPNLIVAELYLAKSAAPEVVPITRPITA
jgi:uncharacterized membrane protein